MLPPPLWVRTNRLFFPSANGFFLIVQGVGSPLPPPPLVDKWLRTKISYELLRTISLRSLVHTGRWDLPFWTESRPDRCVWLIWLSSSASPLSNWTSIICTPPPRTMWRNLERPLFSPGPLLTTGLHVSWAISEAPSLPSKVKEKLTTFPFR